MLEGSLISSLLSGSIEGESRTSTGKHMVISNLEVWSQYSLLTLYKVKKSGTKR